MNRNQVTFSGGPYDGVIIGFSDRMPQSIALSIECLGADANDPQFQEALRANLAPRDIDGLVVIRNGRSVSVEYVEYRLEEPGDAPPYYRYLGWTVKGVSAT